AKVEGGGGGGGARHDPNLRCPGDRARRHTARCGRRETRGRRCGQPCKDADMEPYAAHVSLRWSDMDAYAHINNVQFLRLLEDARVIAFRDWFDRADGGGRSLLDEGVLVSRHEIEYRRPLGFRHEPV